MKIRQSFFAVLVLALLWLFIFCFGGCDGIRSQENTAEKEDMQEGSEGGQGMHGGEESENSEDEDMAMSFIVTVEGIRFSASFADTDAAKAFSALLPAEFEMQELNGNEKYVYLQASLPASPERVERIETGDIMLWGNNCLVIFYKSFTSSYRYTKIGKIDDGSSLAALCAGGSVSVAFAF